MGSSCKGFKKCCLPPPQKQCLEVQKRHISFFRRCSEPGSCDEHEAGLSLSGLLQGWDFQFPWHFHDKSLTKLTFSLTLKKVYNSTNTLILLHTLPLYYERIWAAVLRTKQKYVIQTSLSLIQTGALCITDAALCNTDDSVCNTDEPLLEFVFITEKNSM